MLRSIALAVLVLCPLPGLALGGVCCAANGCFPTVTGCPGGIAVNTCADCQVGACCMPWGCFTITGPHCPADGSVFLGNGTTCGAVPCPALGVCCSPLGACTVTSQAACVGTFDGSSTSCRPTPCVPLAVCCGANGGCAVSPQASCGGAWISSVTACGPDTCTGQTSACCNKATGGCAMTTAQICAGLKASFGSALGQICTPQGCPAPSGACCTPQSCAAKTQLLCTNTWKGPGSVCAPNPCCPADFTGGNGVELADIFAFLTAWFADCP